MFIIVRVDTRDDSEMFWSGIRFTKCFSSAYEFCSRNIADRKLCDILSRSRYSYHGFYLIEV